MELSYIPSFLLYAVLPLLLLFAIWFVRRRTKTGDDVFLTILPEDLKASFLDAALYSRETSAKLSNEEKLQLYSYYKQARMGDCLAERPHMSDIYGMAKWEAWSKLRGVSAEEAADKYIDLVGTYYPDFFEEEGYEYEGEEYEGEEDVEVGGGEGRELEYSDDDGQESEGEEGEEGGAGAVSVAPAVPASESFSRGVAAGEEGIKVGEASDWRNDHTIHDYVANDKISSVRRLLTLDPSCVDSVDDEGMRPLHWAVDRNNLKMVQLLLSHHADVNALDNEDCPPLAFAQGADSVEIVSVLLKAGADPQKIPKSELECCDPSILSLMFPTAS